MLAAHCPSCGAANAVSLATPDAMACGFCRYAGPPPPQTAAHLRAAASVLQTADARGRQLNRAQRAALARAGCRKFVFVGLLLALTLPFVIFAGVCTATSSVFQWWVVALLGFGPLGVVLISGALGLFIMSRARRNLENACAAVPPRSPGEPAGCHVCGAPLAPAPGAVVAQCGFCRADNVVAPDVLARIQQRQVFVFDTFDREVQRQSMSLGRRSELATNFALVGAALAPVLAGGAAFVVAIIVMSRDAPPDVTIEYLVYPAPVATCLAEIARAPDGTAIADFGSSPPLGFEKRLRLTQLDKFTIWKVSDLVGKRVHTTQGAAVVESVHEDGLALGHNTLRVRRADGSTVKQRVDGSCLVAKGPGPNKLGPFRDGGRGLAVTGDRIFTLAASRVISYHHSGTKAEVATARHSTRPLFVVHSGKVFLAAGRTLLSVQGSAASVLDELAVDITGLTAHGGRLFVAATSELKAYDLEGKTLATFAVPSTRALTTDGVSLFGVTQDGVYRVGPTGGDVDLLWDQGSPSGLVVVDAAHVYFHDGDQLMQLNKSGGTPRSLTKVGPAVSALTADDQHLYWSLDQRKAEGSGSGGVFRLAKAGGEPENLAPEARQVTALALWGRRLIWIEEYGDVLLTLSLD